MTVLTELGVSLGHVASALVDGMINTLCGDPVVMTVKICGVTMVTFARPCNRGADTTAA